MTGPDPAATARRREVALAGHRGDASAALAGLRDPEPAVRAAALGALDRLGILTGDQLGQAAADPAAAVRSRAAELAPAAGPAGVELLVPLLGDTSPTVVEAACFGLGEAGEQARSHPPVLVELDRVARGHPDPLCREAAVAAVGAIGDPAGLATVLAGMADKPAVRRRAVLALAAFDGPEVDAALEQALADRDWQVRQAAEDLTGRLDT
ncbi:MAG TPA: HEAT repeat domain-containing protein [Acidimicrobiales bacterium]|nr:HEAT repeat domain-containing protein [Acidimicrobiales bacterium]